MIGEFIYVQTGETGVICLEIQSLHRQEGAVRAKCSCSAFVASCRSVLVDIAPQRKQLTVALLQEGAIHGEEEFLISLSFCFAKIQLNISKCRSRMHANENKGQTVRRTEDFADIPDAVHTTAVGRFGSTSNESGLPARSLAHKIKNWLHEAHQALDGSKD